MRRSWPGDWTEAAAAAAPTVKQERRVLLTATGFIAGRSSAIAVEGEGKK